MSCASGNGGGPSFSPGFQSFGNYDSASYNAYPNSRYMITVTGVDHDGQYKNADGTFTSYPEAGSSVLVAAPTGSNVAQNVGRRQRSGQRSLDDRSRRRFRFQRGAAAEWRSTSIPICSLIRTTRRGSTARRAQRQSRRA